MFSMNAAIRYPPGRTESTKRRTSRGTPRRPQSRFRRRSASTPGRSRRAADPGRPLAGPAPGRAHRPGWPAAPAAAHGTGGRRGPALVGSFGQLPAQVRDAGGARLDRLDVPADRRGQHQWVQIGPGAQLQRPAEPARRELAVERGVMHQDRVVLGLDRPVDLVEILRDGPAVPIHVPVRQRRGHRPILCRPRAKGTGAWWPSVSGLPLRGRSHVAPGPRRAATAPVPATAFYPAGARTTRGALADPNAIAPTGSATPGCGGPSTASVSTQ
ncbi:MAG: hypothetical protein QOH97_4512 [Actinoplanes sp.]|nr:hypothetical protein [Actinoplanes sp.]